MHGKTLYAANCGSCHGASGEGAEGPALANPVLLANATDTYLVQTILVGRRDTSMQGFALGSTTRRELSQPEVESIVAYIRTWEPRP